MENKRFEITETAGSVKGFYEVGAVVNTSNPMRLPSVEGVPYSDSVFTNTTDGIVAGEQRQKDLAHPGTESCAEHCTCLFQTGGNVQHGVFEHGEHERKNVQAHHQHQTAQCEEDLFASGGCGDQLLQKPLVLHK